MGVTKEWLEQWESVKGKLKVPFNLEDYFTEKKIGETKLDILDIGTVYFPTGKIEIFDACAGCYHPARPFIQTVKAGTYPVRICVMPSEQRGDKYVCVKVEFSGKKPVKYELAVQGNEKLEDVEEDMYFGFFVDSGLGCIADVQTKEALLEYWKKREAEEDMIDPFNDLFDDLLIENSEQYPKYQSEYGSWVNWTIPETKFNIPVFETGFGDGYYPSYFGYDENGEICAFYALFISL